MRGASHFFCLIQVQPHNLYFCDPAEVTLSAVMLQKLLTNHLIVCLVPSVSGGGPSSVSVSEETAVSLMVSWVPPNAHVLQYRVTYTALTGAEGQDNTVSELEQAFILRSTGWFGLEG